MKPFVTIPIILFALAALSQGHILKDHILKKKYVGALLSDEVVADEIAQVAGGLGTLIRAKLNFLEGLLASKTKSAEIAVEIGGSHAYASGYGGASHDSAAAVLPVSAPVKKVYFKKVINKSTTVTGSAGHYVSQAAPQVASYGATHVAAPQVASYGVSHVTAPQVASYGVSHVAAPQVASYAVPPVATRVTAPQVASYGVSHGATHVAAPQVAYGVPPVATHGSSYGAAPVANYGSSYGSNYATGHATRTYVAPAPAPVKYVKVIRKTLSVPVISQPVATYSYSAGWAKGKK